MSRKQDFSVFLRKLPSGKEIFYYSCYNSDGKRKQYSTGCTKQEDAIRYCLKQLQDGKLIPTDIKLFSDYAKNWFDYDNCRYIQGKISRGYTYSKSNADRQRAVLNNHILPYFGSIQLNRLSTGQIEDWLLDLKAKGLTNCSINNYLAVLRTIINEAFRLQLIPRNPIKTVQRFKDDVKEKGILNDLEIHRLFHNDRQTEIWPQNMHYTINYLASNTGLRMGEIQALKAENIHPDHLLINSSWDRVYGLKGTKTNRNRIVPISPAIYAVLRPFLNHDTGFIFSKDGEKPLSSSCIKKWLYRSLAAIEIDEYERKARNITFHSWRHYFNSRLRASGIPDAIVQQVIGHQDIRMSENYTHFSQDQLACICEVQSG